MLNYLPHQTEPVNIVANSLFVDIGQIVRFHPKSNRNPLNNITVEPLEKHLQTKLKGRKLDDRRQLQSIKTIKYSNWLASKKNSMENSNSLRNRYCERYFNYY